jgi:alkylation response protein AidB-like acyl-CoA dehydrogenase
VTGQAAAVQAVSGERQAAAGQGSFASDLAGYRAALRRYLAASPDLERWRGCQYSSVEERITDHAAMMRVLCEGGWNRYGWPEEAGGLGGDPRHRAVLYDELSAADLPVPDPHLMLETLGPPLLRFAPHLAARFLPSYLRGEEWWGQGFSEPEAGSDLAALRCRARLDGDHYLISGQKLWTSHGATATRLVALVRTGTPESRHRGLSMIMIDLDAPGVSVRPVELASGARELAEIFLDEVTVPRERLVGAEGQGWAVAMYLLQYERAMYAWQSAATALHQLRELTELLRTRHAAGPLPDGAAIRLGECYADVVTLRARSADTVRRLASGQTVGPEASVDKVLLATAETQLHDLARDLLGADFMFGAGPQFAQWRADWWYSRSSTILGGSAEVQRTILADHVLGLPAEPKA